MKKQWIVFAIVLGLVALCAPAEAQVPVYNINGTVAYGVPAGPYNGTVRHDYNGYVGVNPRHYSRVPMRYGTGPIRAIGPIYAAPRPGYGHGCGAYPVYRPIHHPAYIARRPIGGGFVTGGAVIYPVGNGGSGGYIQFSGGVGW